MFNDPNVKAFDPEEYKAERGPACLKREMDEKIAKIEPLMKQKCNNQIAREIKKIEKDFSQKHKILLNEKKNIEKKLEQRENALDNAIAKKKPIIVDEIKELKKNEIKVLREELAVIQNQLKELRTAKLDKTKNYIDLKSRFDEGKETLKKSIMELDKYKAEKTLLDIKEKNEREMMEKEDLRPKRAVSPTTMATRVKKMQDAKAAYKAQREGEREMMGMEDVDVLSGNQTGRKISPKQTRKLSPTSAAAFKQKMAEGKTKAAKERDLREMLSIGIADEPSPVKEKTTRKTAKANSNSKSLSVSSVSSNSIENKKTQIDELLKTTRARRDEVERLKGDAWREFKKIPDTKAHSPQKKTAKKTYEDLKREFDSLEKKAKTFRKKETKINDILKRKGLKTRKVQFKQTINEAELSPGDLATKKNDVMNMIREKLGLRDAAENAKRRAKSTYNETKEKTQKAAAKKTYEKAMADYKQIDDELKALRARQDTINIKLGKSTKAFAPKATTVVEKETLVEEIIPKKSSSKSASPVKEKSELEALMEEIEDIKTNVIRLKGLIPTDKSDPDHKKRVREYNAEALKYKALKEKIEALQA